MRIISGRNKGRKIVAPVLPVRPTTDMAKESLFNILGNLIDLEETRALDLFAGTGNITYELFSRGCAEVTSVDINPKCIAFIRQTCLSLDYQGLQLQSDCFRYIGNNPGQWDLVFADPPYGMERVPELPGLVFTNHLLRPGGYFVLEHDKHLDFEGHERLVDRRKYGKVHFSFFREAQDPKNSGR